MRIGKNNWIRWRGSRQDSLHYGRAGKAIANVTAGDSVAFSSRGAIRYAAYANAAGPEQMSDDALGNHASMWVPANSYQLHVYSYQAGSDRLIRAIQPSITSDTTYYFPDVYGAVGEQLDVHRFPVGTGFTEIFGREERDLVNDYNLQQQLIRTRYTLDTVDDDQLPPTYKAYHRNEYYRYDALGRRVVQRMVLDTGVTCQQHDPNSGCRNLLTRTVWDGDQILFEMRVPGDTTGTEQEDETFTGVQYGAVGYVEGPGVDRPLEIFQGTTAVVPFANWRGQYDFGQIPAPGGGSTITFPGSQAASYGSYPLGSPGAWWGSLAAGSQDGSGYQYRRNRYYDPSTGRFTQQDPSGLAGGLNAYGFANNDPISYADPFGLDPWWLQTAARVSIELVAFWAHLHMAPLPSQNPSVVRPAQAHPTEELLEAAKEVGPETMGKTSSETASEVESSQALDAATAASARVAPAPPTTPFQLTNGEALTNIGAASDGAPIFEVAPAALPTAEAAAPVAEATGGAESLEGLIALIASLF